MTADYTGKIRSKGLNGTGITEGLIGKHHRNHGGNLMIVASVKAVATHDDLDTGGGGVDYVLDDIEVAPDMTLENGLNPAEYVRELVRSFHYERSLEDQGDLLDDQRIEPKVDDVLARGDAHKPHPFLPTDAADENGTCEVCGLGEPATPHAAYALGARADQDDDAEELSEPDGITDADTLVDDDLDGATDHVPDEDAPAEFDVQPPRSELRKLAHVHVGGVCVKHRGGPMCTDESLPAQKSAESVGEA